MYYIEEENNISVSVKMIDGAVVLHLNGEEIAYFDSKGLYLLPECEGKVPKGILDSNGYLNIIKE